MSNFSGDYQTERLQGYSIYYKVFESFTSGSINLTVPLTCILRHVYDFQ